MIEHDPALFEAIYADAKTQFGAGYSTLWKSRVRDSEIEIRRNPQGLKKFRSNWNISRGYTDSFCIDPADSVPPRGWKAPLFRALAKNALAKKLWLPAHDQIRRLHEDGLRYKNYYYQNFYGGILEKMVRRIPQDIDTLAGDSRDYAVIGGRKVSIRHIYTLLRLHDLEQQADLKNVETIVEVGGGFGVNAECMLHLYPNIRKYVIIDIPSCLYTASLYLRSTFGAQVKTYLDIKNGTPVDMSSAGREIFVIAPWQIDRLAGKLDLLVNLFSFQVFAQEDIRSYTKQLAKLCHGQSMIWLGGYESPTSLTRQQVLDSFDGIAAFQSVPHNERGKHGDTTWFCLGRPARQAGS